MKIGLVFPYNIAKGGGVKEIVVAMQTELIARGHDVHIITPQPRDYDPECAEHKNLIFVGTATDFNSPLSTTIQVSAGLNESIDTMLAEHNFDILHFHEPWVPVLSRQILTRSNTVNVATFHAKLPENMMSRTIAKVVTPYTKSVLKYIDKFTAVSDAAAEYVCSLTDVPVAIIPNGIDLDRYKVPARRSDKRKHKTIFYVGRLEGRKGVKYLLQAFSILQQREPNVSLIIAGDGPDREKLEMLVDDLQIKNVTFAGYITEKEKLSYLRTADLFSVPALYGESFGIVLLEAMASGLVTVAGDNPGYASVMKGLGALSLVDPKDAEEFARRMELLLNEVELRKLWRAWAEEEITQYSYPTIVTQYEEIYQQALKHHADK
ncbi:MAG: glycosyltransferase family 4 protein [Candidatus Saccharibacteria bacterium]